MKENDDDESELSQECGNDEALNDTYTGDSVNESMQLSLPDSFDDTFSALDGLSGYIQHQKPEMCLLQAQLYESKERVKKMQKEREQAIQFLDGNIHDSHQSIISIKSQPRSKRSLVQMVKLNIHDQVLEKMARAETMIQQATNESEITKQRQEKAANTELLCNQKVMNLEDALNAAKDRHNEATERVALLQMNILELKEKGRMFDDTLQKNKSLRDEVNRMRGAMEHKEAELGFFTNRDSDAQATIKNLERKTQSLDMEKSFMEKEKCILLERTERVEEATKGLERLLQNAVAKADNLTVRLSETNLKAKAIHDSKVVEQVKQTRSECEKEFSSYRSQVEGAFERECKMLKEAKTEVVAHYEVASAEILRLNKLMAHRDASFVTVERTLCDVGGDLKIKCIEASRLHVTNENMEKSLIEYRSQQQMMSDELQAHKLAFKNLEKESMFERQRLHDEIKRKDDQLEMYHQSHTEDFKNISSPSPPVNYLHLLDKSSSLTNKCHGLETQIQNLRQKLKRQIEKSRSYESKLTTANLTIQNIHQDDQPDTQGGVNALAESLRADNCVLRNERDRLSKDFSNLLTKYFDLAGKLDITRNEELHTPKKRSTILWTMSEKSVLSQGNLAPESNLLLKHAVHHATANT